ncbi:MAG: hypothetical protein ACHREM_22215 [Polyangiales bacterium]
MSLRKARIYAVVASNSLSVACTGSIGGPSAMSDDAGAVVPPDATANDTDGTGHADAMHEGSDATDGTAVAPSDVGGTPPAIATYDDCSSSATFNCAVSDPATPLPFVNGAQTSGCVCSAKCSTDADCPGAGTCVNGGNCLPPCGSTICPPAQQCLNPYRSGALVCSPDDLATFVTSPPPGTDAGRIGGGGTSAGGSCADSVGNCMAATAYFPCTQASGTIHAGDCSPKTPTCVEGLCTSSCIVDGDCYFGGRCVRFKGVSGGWCANDCSLSASTCYDASITYSNVATNAPPQKCATNVPLYDSTGGSTTATVCALWSW